MSGKSSSAAEWFSLLEPAQPADDLPRRPDDPRLGEITEFWQGNLDAVRPGRAVLIGFPQDEGVKRNLGRPGPAEAPRAIRGRLYRLTPWDGENDLDLTGQPPLDAGDVRIQGGLEESQQALGTVVAGCLRQGAVPVILGGGHETAFGHYLGYAADRRPVGVINIDAHLDVRPYTSGGHSGSPFRQMMEHPPHPLPGTRYVCLGAQPFSVSRQHWLYAREQGCVIRWASEVEDDLHGHFARAKDRLAAAGCQVYVTLDADAVHVADVPGVSAPNPRGLSGRSLLACARLAGQSPQVASFDLVEINPRHDRDDQSSRWAALVVWNILMGVAERTLG